MKTKDRIVICLRGAKVPLSSHIIALRIARHHTTVAKHCQELAEQGVLIEVKKMGLSHAPVLYKLAPPRAQKDQGNGSRE